MMRDCPPRSMRTMQPGNGHANNALPTQKYCPRTASADEPGRSQGQERPNSRRKDAVARRETQTVMPPARADPGVPLAPPRRGLGIVVIARGFTRRTRGSAGA